MDRRAVLAAVIAGAAVPVGGYTRTVLRKLALSSVLSKVVSQETDVRAVTGKLMTYAVGREMEYFDAPAIRGIVRAASADDYRWSSTILAIVKSTPFQMRRSRS